VTEAADQRVVVYTHRTTGKKVVYCTAYDEVQMRRGVVSCRRRHGERSQPRTRRA
jgi:hypothetical protein